jgi:hypothetical protein
MSNTLKNREVFRVGTHNGDKYTHKDLDAMVTAFQEMDFLPAIKIGHAQNGSDAYGYVDNLRRDGDRLVADFTHIDDEIKDKVDARKLSRVSGEVYWNFERNGKKYPRVLGAVALLGHEIPGVAGLKPLYENYSDGAVTRCYEFEFATGDDQRGNADDNTQEQTAMSIEKVQAELAALQKNHDAAQAELKKYQDDQAKLYATAKEAEALKVEVSKLREDASKRAIKEKTDALSIPALRPMFAALYAVDAGETKLKVYEAGKESEKSVSEVLDSMVAHLNDKIAPMFKQYSKQDEQTEPVQADNKVDAGKLIDKLVGEHIAKHKSDYSTALSAVMRDHAELARVYASH